ncbi:MAG: WD40 repeat domain-containing protein [Commensalibacter sp.]
MALQSQLMDDRGHSRKIEGSVIDCVISRDGQYLAYVTADGDLWIATAQDKHSPDQWKVYHPHDGGILCLSQDISPQGFLTGGDDNTVQRFIPGQPIQCVAKASRWVEHLTSWYNLKTQQGLFAFVAGKQVEVYKNQDKEPCAVLQHDSTVSGIDFSQYGTALACSHYNGATLWAVDTQEKREFVWKGSHIGVIMHPYDEALITAMQENDLHGWRLSDGHNMRMSGYPTKVKSLSFSMNGKWLATSGTENVVMWPFFDGGPIGKPPAELTGIPNSCCTQVTFHPQYEMLAAGFLDGSVLLVDTDAKKVLPVCFGNQQSHGSITALSFSPAGDLLSFGTENGTIAVLDLS